MSWLISFLSLIFFPSMTLFYYSQLFFPFLFLVVNSYIPFPTFSQQYPSPLSHSNPPLLFFSYLLRSRYFFFYICLTYFIFTLLKFLFLEHSHPHKNFSHTYILSQPIRYPPGFVIPPSILFDHHLSELSKSALQLSFFPASSPPP